MIQHVAPSQRSLEALQPSGVPWSTRVRRLLRSRRPYLAILGIGAFFLSWYLLVDVLRVWRFRELPGFAASVREWLSPDPTYGISLFTSDYYLHIWASLYRVYSAFALATLLGVTIGILMGWRRIFYGLTFPVLELLRPIPVLAWIPLAIILLPGRELPIIGLTFLAAFFVTILNTLLGVRSIDPVYFRAARSLGFTEFGILVHVILPGALPYIFVGLQIAMGACWFSLVASEIASGQAGLGYEVWQAYYYVQFETMVIIMATLGFLGYVSSALVRLVANRLMRWRSRVLVGA
jgi:NitT/TauT family transport system permease protein